MGTLTRQQAHRQRQAELGRTRWEVLVTPAERAALKIKLEGMRRTNSTNPGANSMTKTDAISIYDRAASVTRDDPTNNAAHSHAAAAKYLATTNQSERDGFVRRNPTQAAELTAYLA